MKHILVTGANGQLGKCIQDVAATQKDVTYVFTTHEQLSITSKSAIEEIFSTHQFNYCINAAAYTNVENAESNEEIAFAINAEGAKNIAEVCAAHNTTLLHISTDYVFDGKKRNAYTENDPTNPINVYGASKLAGEGYVQSLCEKHYIFRTSWLYSQYGHNFLKTILKHGKAGTQLSITTEQKGTPTNANDLAKVLHKVVTKDTNCYGLYHFSNKGIATWYDFAFEILTRADELSTSNLAKTDHYRTFAQRPAYSVLDTTKLKNRFNIRPVDWTESLQTVLDILEIT